ncbi:MAG: SDR family oxidoreductase [Pseudomonadota bacterium]
MLITGAAGHVGRALLSNPAIGSYAVTACDINPIADASDKTFSFQTLDVRETEMVDAVFATCKPQVVIHLASVVTPPQGTGRQFAYDVDVEGTQNIIDACLKHEVGRLIVTSSGAAYGYHPDNDVPLSESSPIRGNYEFPYSHHKRLVEEKLAEARDSNPELEQVVLRVGTVLGNGLENQITALFRKPRLLGLTGNESPFVFIWDTDLTNIILMAVDESEPGIFNVAGDGSLGVSALARILGKPVLRFPAWFLKAALAIAFPLGLSRYGPEQVRFLQFRPILDNLRLKQEFGYVPKKTSLEAFEAWRKQAGL